VSAGCGRALLRLRCSCFLLGATCAASRSAPDWPSLILSQRRACLLSTPHTLQLYSYSECRVRPVANPALATERKPACRLYVARSYTGQGLFAYYPCVTAVYSRLNEPCVGRHLRFHHTRQSRMVARHRTSPALRIACLIAFHAAHPALVFGCQRSAPASGPTSRIRTR